MVVVVSLAAGHSAVGLDPGVAVEEFLLVSGENVLESTSLLAAVVALYCVGYSLLVSRVSAFRAVTIWHLQSLAGLGYRLARLLYSRFPGAVPSADSKDLVKGPRRKTALLPTSWGLLRFPQQIE